MHDQAVGDDLQKCLDSEDDEEGIFHCFLWTGMQEGGMEGGGDEGEKKRRKKGEKVNLHSQKKTRNTIPSYCCRRRGNGNLSLTLSMLTKNISYFQQIHHLMIYTHTHTHT